jgi:hypothetical protein
MSFLQVLGVNMHNKFVSNENFMCSQSYCMKNAEGI